MYARKCEIQITQISQFHISAILISHFSQLGCFLDFTFWLPAITKIILHCSASRAGVDLTANDIRSYHCNPPNLGGRGWKHPGYHYVVRLSGRIEPLLLEHLVANGVKGHNAESIHVCYVGGLDLHGKPVNTLTPSQLAALNTLLGDLLARYPAAKLHSTSASFATPSMCSFSLPSSPPSAPPHV